MRLIGLIAAAAIGAAAWVPSAYAATITQTIDFTATGFTTTLGSAVPQDPVIGSFTITYDPALSYNDESAGIVLNNININVSTPLLFTYDPVSTWLAVGPSPTANGTQWNVDDFMLAIFLQGGGPFFMYTQAGIVDDFSTENVTFSATPIPASLVMLLTALGLLGGTGMVRAVKVKQPASAV